MAIPFSDSVYLATADLLYRYEKGALCYGVARGAREKTSAYETYMARNAIKGQSARTTRDASGTT